MRINFQMRVSSAFDCLKATAFMLSVIHNSRMTLHQVWCPLCKKRICCSSFRADLDLEDRSPCSCARARKALSSFFSSILCCINLLLAM
jgi:hypothetical protein